MKINLKRYKKTIATVFDSFELDYKSDIENDSLTMESNLILFDKYSVYLMFNVDSEYLLCNAVFDKLERNEENFKLLDTMRRKFLSIGTLCLNKADYLTIENRIFSKDANFVASAIYNFLILLGSDSTKELFEPFDNLFIKEEE